MFSALRSAASEVARMIEGFDAYWGTFDVDPDRSQVVHHVQGALEPGVVGRDRIRTVTPDRGLLTLVVPPKECW
ncbi:MAG: lipocalin-like domain-containing protein [Proteobacteria bacterium]|nr:lipocalin-like domain-containing protein [Pseudomonadota bacterium]